MLYGDHNHQQQLVAFGECFTCGAQPGDRAAEPEFDGPTYRADQDHDRLTGQLHRVLAHMADGHWHTLADLSAAVGAPEASCSARLRDLRKPKFGAYLVEHRRAHGTEGLWLYRLVRPPDPHLG